MIKERQVEFRAATRPWPKKGWNGREVGSYLFRDTPRSLYRLLYAARPPALDMSDMRTSGAVLIGLISACGRFAALFELWKYELAVRLCSASRSASLVRGAVYDAPWQAPASEVLAKIADPEARQFFEVVITSLESPWSIYPGNHFEV